MPWAGPATGRTSSLIQFSQQPSRSRLNRQLISFERGASRGLVTADGLVRHESADTWRLRTPRPRLEPELRDVEAAGEAEELLRYRAGGDGGGRGGGGDLSPRRAAAGGAAVQQAALARRRIAAMVFVCAVVALQQTGWLWQWYTV